MVTSSHHGDDHGIDVVWLDEGSEQREPYLVHNDACEKDLQWSIGEVFFGKKYTEKQFCQTM